MDVVFILAQVFGVVAWLLLMLSYYKENTKKILAVQLLSISFYFLNYLLLGAFAGLFVILIELIRDFAYYKTNKSKLIFVCTIPFYLLLAYFTKSDLVNLIPVCAAIIEGFTLTKKKFVIVPGAIIVYSLWVIYDLSVMSYTGVLTDSMIIGSNILIVIGYLIRLKKIEDFKIISDHHIDKETFEKIFSLDKKNYDEEILWDSKYQEDLYKKNKDSFSFIKYNKKIIGYINYLVVDKEIHDEIVSLNKLRIVYDEKYILKFRKNKDNYVIIDSIVINPAYDSDRAAKLFSRAIRKYFLKKAVNGYYMSSVICIGVTDFEKKVLEFSKFIKIKELDNEHILYMYKKGDK